MSAARRLRAADRDVGSGLPGPVGVDGLTFDRHDAVDALTRSDERLARLVHEVGPYDVQPDGDLEPYAYLLRSIVFQQLNGTAAATIHQRLLDLFDGEVPHPTRLLDASADHLRGAGVSAGKAASLHDLARHALAGELPSRAELATMSDAAVVDRLTVVRGIGPWTVHMLLMFRLGRPDVLPTGDFGVREGWRLLHGVATQPTPAELREHAEPWRPFRSVASWYLWRAVDLHREGRLPSP